MAMQATDTFVGVLEDGSERVVKKNEPFPEDHELVRRDRDASKSNPGRQPLFRPMDLGDDKPKSARGSRTKA